MSGFPPRLAKLQREMRESRYQLLKMEVRTCLNAIDFGNMQLDRGDREYAAREFRAADKAYAAILHFLPELDDARRRNEMETELRRVREALDGLRNKLRPAR
jgi:hypothetical protein